ncbi:MAG: TenA family protein [Alphaproteobacteria bacterium]|nr:TenA family protein [Alphaproteobacteria bacterium]
MIKTDKYGIVFNKLKSNTLVKWNLYTQHKFVQKVSDGSLDKKLYLKYLKQDYVFLIHFSRAWALLVAKSKSVNEMRIASATLDALVNEEIQLHIKTCKDEGITEEQLFKTEEELNNLAYTRFVLEAGYSGDFLDLLVALSPCVFGYGEIGLYLKSISKNDNPYISWINTYNSKEYQEVCINIGSLLDEATQDRLGKDFANNVLWPKLEKTFLIATKLEIDFWEMSLKLE